MNVERIACIECGAMILPRTASKYDGMCPHCHDRPQWLRDEQREYERALASGAVFTPSRQERESAKMPAEFLTADTEWMLDPDYYAEQRSDSVAENILAAAQQDSGNIFLRSTAESRFNLSFTEAYGVCEYQSEKSGDALFAYTKHNLRHQVAENDHVCQACPCCGVALGWFPSRFHMPRSIAFEIVTQISSGRGTQGVEWFEMGDITFTSRGTG